MQRSFEPLGVGDCLPDFVSCGTRAFQDVLPFFEEAFQVGLQLASSAALGEGAALGELEVFLCPDFVRFGGVPGLLHGAQGCFDLTKRLVGGFFAGLGFARPIRGFVCLGHAGGPCFFESVDALFCTLRALDSLAESRLGGLKALRGGSEVVSHTLEVTVCRLAGDNRLCKLLLDLFACCAGGGL